MYHKRTCSLMNYVSPIQNQNFPSSTGYPNIAAPELIVAEFNEAAVDLV